MCDQIENRRDIALTHNFQTRFGPETTRVPPRVPPAPVPVTASSQAEPVSPPRIWMTRDQARETEARSFPRSDIGHLPPPGKNSYRPWQPMADEPAEGGSKNSPVLYHTPANHPNRFPPPPVADFPEGRPGSRRARNVPEDRSEDHAEAYSTGGRSLEGRLSSQVESPYPNDAPRPSDYTSSPAPPLQARARSTRDEELPADSGKLWRTDRVPASWDRSDTSPAKDEQAPPLKVHPQRAALLERQAGPPVPFEQESSSPAVYVETMKTSKPVRIRRPPPGNVPPHDGYIASGSGNPEPLDGLPGRSRGSSYRPDDLQLPTNELPPRPVSLRRGSSLLERLTLGEQPPSVVPEQPSPSLRDRVEPSHEPMTSSQSDMGMEAEYEENVNARSPRGGAANGGAGGRGGRKRGGKPRRGNGRRGN